MSLSGALTNAMSGLSAASRNAHVTSHNIANAMTQGYSVRSLSVASNGYTGGVLTNGVIRHSDPVLLAERRTADADAGQAGVTNAFYTRLESLVGTPDQSSSLSGTFSAFEAALISATGGPESDVRLQSVADRASMLAQSINTSANGIKDMREQADSEIGKMVDGLNGLLSQTETLNKKISQAAVQGKDTATLMDQRQQVIDQINEIVPVRTMERDNGGLALYSSNGATLLDGKAYEIEFSPTPTIMPHMTQGNGLLSGLSINGQALSTDSDRGPLAGGKLAAQFQVRDEHTVTAQAELDAIARDLVDRFQNSGADPTLAAGDPGLFTDGGAAFDPANEVGLAGRLDINGLVSPDGAEEYWRLRDGLGAAAPGDVGDNSVLTNLVDVVQTSTVPGSGALGSKAVSMSEMFGNLHSSYTTNRVTSDSELTFAAAQQDTLVSMELAQGVDTDTEMQNLMLIEQAYTANAKIIQAVDEMMATILGI
ncbi:Flagellar hook-associated protein 1 [Shimia sp. SK013]|uniref:flagellar hook-associated protein FlgK n=1 Tax=Shimia sp. SK013 TaxID=1389006 RepID=UPI0006CD86B1|nr:flagellar hook-associated protein FlgK [Shimia sp. SK013]KPA20352.1 Flagellar hook-associated protein 1 [Shimia sp. SK013]